MESTNRFPIGISQTLRVCIFSPFVYRNYGRVVFMNDRIIENNMVVGMNSVTIITGPLYDTTIVWNSDSNYTENAIVIGW